MRRVLLPLPGAGIPAAARAVHLWDSYGGATPAASLSYGRSPTFRAGRRIRAARIPPFSGRPTMLDAIFLALGIAGFAACLGYVYLCERL
jgi:hypothetical protein